MADPRWSLSSDYLPTKPHAHRTPMNGRPAFPVPQRPFGCKRQSIVAGFPEIALPRCAGKLEFGNWLALAGGVEARIAAPAASRLRGPFEVPASSTDPVIHCEPGRDARPRSISPTSRQIRDNESNEGARFDRKTKPGNARSQRREYSTALSQVDRFERQVCTAPANNRLPAYKESRPALVALRNCRSRTLALHPMAFRGRQDGE